MSKVPSDGFILMTYDAYVAGPDAQKYLAFVEAAVNERRGAKAVIAALVKKYGPCQLSVTDIVEANHEDLIITNGVDGFTYEHRRAADSSGDPGGSR